MQVISDPQRHERMQKLEPVATKAELAKQAAPATSVVTPPKVDYATDLFNLLYPKDSGQNDSETSSANDSMGTSFQCLFSFDVGIAGVFFFFFASLLVFSKTQSSQFHNFCKNC